MILRYEVISGIKNDEQQYPQTYKYNNIIQENIYVG